MEVSLVCEACDGDGDSNFSVLACDRDRASDAADFETTGKSGSESLSSWIILPHEKDEEGLRVLVGMEVEVVCEGVE